MIRLSVLYPATEGAAFDHDYYRDNHVPLCLSTWGLERADVANYTTIMPVMQTSEIVG